MIFPAITAFYAALLGLVLFGLSAWVIAGRGQYRVIHGDGGHDSLSKRIRAHANFVEYVPLIVLLSAFLESSGASRPLLRYLLLALLIARVLHPFGMVAKVNSPQQFALRGLPAIVTFAVLLVMCVVLLIRLWP
jgi:uncharacterized membrane protein YecN with MAPEG domain